MEHQGHAHELVVEAAAVGERTVLEELLAVIGGEDDERFLAEALLERGDEAGEVRVEVAQLALVAMLQEGELRWGGGDTLVGAGDGRREEEDDDGEVTTEQLGTATYLNHTGASVKDLAIENARNRPGCPVPPPEFKAVHRYRSHEPVGRLGRDVTLYGDAARTEFYAYGSFE